MGRWSLPLQRPTRLGPVCVPQRVRQAIAAGDPCDLLRLLHGPHRAGLRLVMILLSQQGWAATAIAELLGCDPRTVRRWVHRYNQEGTGGLADRPRPGRPRLGSPRLSARIRRLLGQPKPWGIGLLRRYLGRPAMSLRTCTGAARGGGLAAAPAGPPSGGVTSRTQGITASQAMCRACAGRSRRSGGGEHRCEVGGAFGIGERDDLVAGA